MVTVIPFRKMITPTGDVLRLVSALPGRSSRISGRGRADILTGGPVVSRSLPGRLRKVNIRAGFPLPVPQKPAERSETGRHPF